MTKLSIFCLSRLLLECLKLFDLVFYFDPQLSFLFLKAIAQDSITEFLQFPSSEWFRLMGFTSLSTLPMPMSR